LSGFIVLFLVFDAGIHIAKPVPVVEAFERLGLPLNAAVGIGIAEAICLVLYVIPRTSVIGAVLLTGVLGGAVATHVRAGSTSFETYIFPVIVGLFIWGSLYLRDRRVRALI
jgi:hypothetical protein